MRALKYWLGVLLFLASSLMISCDFQASPPPSSPPALPTSAPATVASTPVPEALAKGEACPSAPGPIADGIVLNRDFDLVSLAASGERTTPLTALPLGQGLRALAPAWSPDGQTLAFALFFMSPDPALNSWVQIAMICGLDRQTGQGRILARGASDRHSLEEVAWAPDGKALLVTQLHYIVDAQGVFERIESSVGRYDLAGGTLLPLAIDASRPAISPDGNLLAYIHQAQGSFDRVLMVAQADGQQRRPLLAGQQPLSNADAPRWSPDGERLLFVASSPAAATPTVEPAAGLLDQLLHVPAARAHGDPAHLWLVRADGQELEQLTSAPLDDPRAAWSADGQQIVYVTTLGPVVLLDLASRQERPLSAPGFAGVIDWSWR